MENLAVNFEHAVLKELILYRVVSSRDTNCVIPTKAHASTILVHIAMVICVVVGCSKRSDRDHDISFHWIPAVVRHTDKWELELSKRRRDGYLAAISREGLDVNNLGKYRICSRHFISGEPAKLFDCTNPDWLPTMNLGHSKREKQQPCSA